MSSVCDSELIAPSRAISSATGRKLGEKLVLRRRLENPRDKFAHGRESHCSLGWIQLVFSFASFNAFAM